MCSKNCYQKCRVGLGLVKISQTNWHFNLFYTSKSLKKLQAKTETFLFTFIVIGKSRWMEGVELKHFGLDHYKILTLFYVRTISGDKENFKDIKVLQIMKNYFKVCQIMPSHSKVCKSVLFHTKNTQEFQCIPTYAKKCQSILVLAHKHQQHFLGLKSAST